MQRNASQPASLPSNDASTAAKSAGIYSGMFKVCQLTNYDAAEEKRDDRQLNIKKFFCQTLEQQRQLQKK